VICVCTWRHHESFDCETRHSGPDRDSESPRLHPPWPIGSETRQSLRICVRVSNQCPFTPGPGDRGRAFDTRTAAAHNRASHQVYSCRQADDRTGILGLEVRSEPLSRLLGRNRQHPDELPRVSQIVALKAGQLSRGSDPGYDAHGLMADPLPFSARPALTAGVSIGSVSLFLGEPRKQRGSAPLHHARDR